MRQVVFLLVFVLPAIFCVSATNLPAQEVSPLNLFNLDENDFSLWRIENADYPYLGEKGCFPVGNGIVFAHLGVNSDFNTLCGVTGPGYQTRGADGNPIYWQEGDWGTLQVKLLTAVGKPLDWKTQSIMRVRGAPIVLVSQISHEAELYSLTYAPPNKPLIIREFVLRGGKLARAFKPLILIDAPAQAQKISDNNRFVNSSGKILEVYTSEELRKAQDQKYWIDAVNPGQMVSFAVVYHFSRKQADEPKINFQKISELRDETLGLWKRWNEGNIVFDTPDPKFNDLMNELPMLIEVQRDAHSGAVSPMVSYHGFWIRDSNGPILTLLANGKSHEVRHMLEYYKKAVWHYKFSHMLVPLDLELPEVPKDADFSSVGVEHAEVPSWIILHHYWYFRYTADKNFIKSAMPLLRRNLLAMPLHEKYGAKFHGDETYTHGALYSTYDHVESGKIGYPNGYIPTDFFSFDNTLIHLEASFALAEMASAVGDNETAEDAQRLSQRLQKILENYRIENGAYAPAVSPVTEEKWFQPFSNINLRKYWLWLVPLKDDDWRDYVWARDEIISKWKYGTTPYSGYSTGHNLAYWLVSAGLLNFREGERFLKPLIELATPEGAWCEVYDPSGTPVAIYGRINRLRPWESGINYEAILRYLTGLTYTANGEWQLSPKLMRNWQSYRIKNLRAGDAIFDLEVTTDEQGFVNMHISVHPEGGTPRLNPLKRIKSLEQLGVQLKKVPGAQRESVKSKKLLVLTKDNSFKNALSTDPRLRTFKARQILVWDIGMPISAYDLRSALLNRNKLRIPFLYIDKKVKEYDRRSFKDGKFWESEELKETFADYVKAGGTIIDEEWQNSAREESPQAYGAEEGLGNKK